MAMTINNNMPAVRSLNALNANQTKLSESLRTAATGLKINSAGDDASAYAISERMRVLLRSLDQNAANVQNGQSMLRVAEGGVKEQLRLMQTVKERVIDAANDTNTDDDRRTIQKEIDGFCDQIEDIAQTTTYNGRRLLTDKTAVSIPKTDISFTPITTWKVSDTATLLEGSDGMGIILEQAKNHHVEWVGYNHIADNDQPPYDTLDGVEGPFDIFDEFKVTSTTIENFGELANTSSVYLTNGADGEACKIEMDFSYLLNRTGTSGFELSDFDDLGFAVTGLADHESKDTYQWVLTTDPTRNYLNIDPDYYFYSVNISDCSSLEDILQKFIYTMNHSESASRYMKVEMNSAKTGLIFTSPLQAIKSNESNIYGITDKNLSDDDRLVCIKKYARGAATETHIFTAGEHFSGGRDPSGDSSYDPVRNPDVQPYIPGASASLTKNITNAEIGSGFAVAGIQGEQSYIKFVSGNTIKQSTGGVWEVGKNAQMTRDIGGHIRLELSNGQLTLRDVNERSYGNNFYIVMDGFPDEYDPGAWTKYDAYDDSKLKRTESTTDATRAYHDFDLSEYRNMDTEDVIDALFGKMLQFKKNLSATAVAAPTVEFIDSGKEHLYGKRTKVSTNLTIDLNDLRSAVNNNGQDVVDTLAKLLKDTDRWVPRTITFCDSDDNDVTGDNDTDPANVEKMRVLSYAYGNIGNSDCVTAQEGNMRQYVIDYGTWFANNGNSIGDIPEYLNDKGFRFYCGTHSGQCFNVLFKNGGDDPTLERDTGIYEDTNEATIVVDVSGVTDAASLVSAIYKQGEPAMETINHYYYFAVDEENPDQLIIYDSRRFTLTSSVFPDMQEKGAKIADGVLNRYQKSVSYEPVVEYLPDGDDTDKHPDRLYIQHTDKANFNIMVRLPSTTMANIFDYDPGEKSYRDFAVTDQAMQKTLLGTDDETGLIDRAIEYLTDAATLLGAQIARLEYAHDNITVANENTQASESLIRDADMVKAITDYTKGNIILQASQSMLAQANQSAGSILGLLQ